MTATNGNAVDWFVDRHLQEGGATGVAFEDPWRSLTRADLAAATHRFAGALALSGIARERRLVMLMPDTVDFPIVFWGAVRAGVIPVPINTLLTPDLVQYVLEDSRAEAITIAEPLLPALLPTLRTATSLRRIIIARPDGSPPDTIDDSRAIGLNEFLAGGDPQTPTVEELVVRWRGNRRWCQASGLATDDPAQRGRGAQGWRRAGSSGSAIVMASARLSSRTYWTRSGVGGVGIGTGTASRHHARNTIGEIHGVWHRHETSRRCSRAIQAGAGLGKAVGGGGEVPHGKQTPGCSKATPVALP